MQQYTNILVIIDPSNEDQPALGRAIQLSHAQNTKKLCLFLAIFDFSYEMTSMFSHEEREAMRSALIHDRKQWLKDLLEPYETHNINFDIVVVWHKRPFEAIINQVIEHQHDLVIKSTHKHPKLQSILFTPTDWHLLRKCPSSVLLVKTHQWPNKGKVVVAINCTEDSERHEALNEKLIKHSQTLSSLLEGQLELVNAYPPMPINLSLELPEFDITDYTEAVRLNHQKQLDEISKHFAIDNEYVHLIEGQAEYAVADYASQIDAELVVLGTIGRNGLSAALIGNTAEHIIDQLECDLLAIKPDDYVSPLQK